VGDHECAWNDRLRCLRRSSGVRYTTTSTEGADFAGLALESWIEAQHSADGGLDGGPPGNFFAGRHITPAPIGVFPQATKH
jgi:hypothetical protein